MSSVEEEFKDARICVVGGAGFVGSNLIVSLLGSSPREIVVIDNLLSSERENLPDASKVAFIEGSAADDTVLSRIEDDFDYVFHLATFHGNQNSIHDPLADHENNTLTTLKLFNRLKSFKRLRKVVYASAGCTVAKKTYGNAVATTEDDPVSLFLDSPYQISKIIGEFYANYFFKQHGLPVVKARFQNVYGPREILGAGKWRGTPATVWRNVIPTFIYKALKEQPLPLENKGEATRDFIYVEDIVRGLEACALRGTPGEVYNLGSGVETSIARLAELIIEISGSSSRFLYLPRRKWDNSGKRFAAIEKAKWELGFVAQIPIEEGLRKTIGWTRQHLDFIEGCIRKHDQKMAAFRD